jgi:hypothetical protein
MPAYTFEIRWDGGEEVRWTYLPTDDKARDYARILFQSLKASGQYNTSARMVVRNHDGATIAAIKF